ncbi:hypothetical protein PR202_ga08196 [Eleusine coracana subsp. coracana]|uniref:Uncharacterized protein n=1 Tax=Eleusine coracana subsp. coracana TaxID=191504 RepID=A0AAV5BZN1_ELECO|nr:hypothetical protein PR202_ga08196 [Eleusine coracana subsp. coracana]
MARLTEEKAALEAGSKGSGATVLNLSHRALSDVSCLSSFKNLERLDLGYNCLVTLEGLSSCVNLKWLSVVENKLVSLKGVEGMSKLQVLNAGKNKLTKMDEVTSITSLGALILNDNNISSICKLDRLQQLNTLVLSKNPVVTIGDALVKAKSMTKKIPSDLAKNVKILNLDLGNNLIERSSDLKVKKFLPNLRILNAKPIEASSKKDKSPIEANVPNKDDNIYDHDAVEIGTKKKDKKQSKKQLKGPEELDVTTSTPSKSEVRKDDKSSANDTGRNTGRKDKKEAKRTKFIDEEDADEIDNTEMSFADLVFSKVDSPEPKLKDKIQEADGKHDGLVIDHTKRKRNQKVLSPSPTSQLLRCYPLYRRWGQADSEYQDGMISI